VFGGSLAAMAERLDGCVCACLQVRAITCARACVCVCSEWRRALQAIEPTSAIYVTWLKDEGALLALLQGARRYYTARALPRHAARAAARLIDHIYYRRFDAGALLCCNSVVLCDVIDTRAALAARLVASASGAATPNLLVDSSKVRM
jgi:hypothetical protein